MATIRISQLTAITAPTDDDILIINDADTNTRKITYANLTQGLLNTTATSQTKTGNLTVGGLIAGNLAVDTNTLFVDSVNNRVGILTSTPNSPLDVNGNIHIRNRGTLEFGDTDDSNFVGLRAPSTVTSDFTLSLPAALPTQGNFITYDNTGAGSFSSETAFINNELRAPYVGARGVTGNSGEVRLYEEVTGGAQFVALKAPASLSNSSFYTLPATYPTVNGQVLASTTSGILSWVTGGGGGGGSPAAGVAGDVQFNDGSDAFAADPSFNYDNGTNTLSVENVDINTDLTVSGNTVIGSTTTDTATVNAQFITDLVPSGARSLGSATNQWSNLFLSGTLTQGGVVLNSTFVNNTVAPSASFSVTLGATATYKSHKLIIVARDKTTNAAEVYEYLVVYGGGTSINGVIGTNAQSPTAGVYLTSVASSVSGANAICTITNTGANNLSITVQATAISA